MTQAQRCLVHRHKVSIFNNLLNSHRTIAYYCRYIGEDTTVSSDPVFPNAATRCDPINQIKVSMYQYIVPALHIIIKVNM